MFSSPSWLSSVILPGLCAVCEIVPASSAHSNPHRVHISLSFCQATPHLFRAENFWRFRTQTTYRRMSLSLLNLASLTYSTAVTKMLNISGGRSSPWQEALFDLKPLQKLTIPCTYGSSYAIVELAKTHVLVDAHDFWFSIVLLYMHKILKWTLRDYLQLRFWRFKVSKCSGFDVLW